MKTIKPARLKSRLRAVHRREQLLSCTLGVLALCNWIVILFLVTFALDWLVRLPAIVRMVVLVPRRFDRNAGSVAVFRQSNGCDGRSQIFRKPRPWLTAKIV